ncbi:tyrosine-type recombinase/integrase [Agrobacterium sp. MAFF310724]|uniref:Riorf9 protein n=1 Tax=Rhizobium rhizogenes TaxID=359 RepID=Q9F5H8_RHIRH|nr:MULTISPECIES: tyrosine-type recombinase/integrase [Rhizobium/Agrobacterium group]MCZ7976403.1 tyrosine-type recombinase/integrase [Agrobacterium salinitolerans]MDA5243291.1 tyrosine-type recombinase/integrase [Agrobacterium sp. MAFF310724]MDA5247527.1 tyrosine-type recombinase/integrase [Agrobacterium sp. MAFF210268]BAB16128.1 riorf9 [Rhizobium rhizogenes]
MLADVDTDRPRDIRDRAILMLLAVYGMRRGEVAALRLDQIDWAGRTLWLFRLKRRQAQIYPLVPSVAEALARYVDRVRPPSSCREVFLRMQAPRHPLGASSIYSVANRRFVALNFMDRLLRAVERRDRKKLTDVQAVSGCANDDDIRLQRSVLAQCLVLYSRVQ